MAIEEQGREVLGTLKQRRARRLLMKFWAGPTTLVKILNSTVIMAIVTMVLAASDETRNQWLAIK